MSQESLALTQQTAQCTTLLVGPSGGRGGQVEGGGVGGWGSKTTSDRDQLGKNLPQMTGSAHQQRLALSLTQFLLDAKHDTCFIPKRLVYTCHDK